MISSELSPPKIYLILQDHLYACKNFGVMVTTWLWFMCICFIDVKEVNIIGVTTVRDGEALNLTCNVHSFPPSLIIWSKLGYNETLHIDNGSANLVITNVTAGDAGQYVCTAKYMNNTLKDKVNVTVICEYTALCFWTEYISCRNTSLHLDFWRVLKYIHYKNVSWIKRLMISVNIYR